MDTTHKTIRFSAEEKETHLWYDPIDHIWKMDSNIPKHFNKAVKQGWTPVSQAVYDDGTVCAMILTAPDGAITIRNLNRKRTMSDAQRVALFGRMQNFTDDELKTYNDMLEKKSEETGVNVFDLFDE